MSVTINAKGTSVPSFTIGKGGITIYQGSVDPVGSNTIKNGDYWLDSGTNSLKTRISGVWLAPKLNSLTFPTGTGTNNQVLKTDGAGILSFTDTVSSVSIVTANGVSGTVATATTTPAITLTLGAITPSSVAATGNISATGTVTGSNLSGTNTGNQTISLTGDVTGSGTGSFTATLATVNSNIGTFASVTVNGKGLVTAAANLSGDATTSGSAITLATVNASPQTDTFRKITVNGKGLVTATSAVASSDITTALGFTPVNKNGDTMTGLLILSGDPSSALGAATKQYVDNLSAGLAAKEACITGTTTTLATSSGGTVTYANGTAGVGATLTTTGTFNTIGGYATINGNRILVKDEATQANNGIYVRTSATVLTRATDFDNSPIGEVEGGDFTFVSNGTLAGTNWVQITPAPITVGTTAIVFSQLSGPGTYTPGTGISITNNVISNTGVLSNIAGTGIGVSGATGNVTITNNGVTSLAGTSSQVAVSGSTGAVTLSLPSSVTISGTMTAGTFAGAGTSLTGTAASFNIGGNAGTATTLQTARNINGVSFNGSTDITITAANPNALTMNNSGTGAASGTTYTGAAAQTISYNTIGASPLAGSASLTTLGTVTTGTWNAGIIPGQYGGTGVANTGRTITIGGNFATTGAFTTTLNVTGNTTVTLPTSGTLVPTTGTGATGSWGISITGSAASANKLNQVAATDADADRGVGVNTFVNTTSSVNFPTQFGNTLEVRRNSGSSSDVGTFQFHATTNTDESLYFRKVTGFTTVDTWSAWQIVLHTGNYLTYVAPAAGSSSITTVGTVTTGTWNAGIIAGQYGGTGVANTGKTITIGGNLVTTGAFATTLNVTGTTNITLPTTGTIYSGSAAPVAGGVIYGSSATQYGSTAAGTTGQALTSTGSGAPVWTTLDLTYIPDAWVKKAVNAATTVIQPITARTATTLTIGGTALTYDGIILANGDRVLVKNSTSGTGAGPHDNGIYVVSGIGTSVVLTRTADADTATELGGATVNVDQGTLNGGLTYTNDFKTTSTVGTTAMNWYQLLSSNDATSTNTANKLVIRDASGNFAAGTITATLTGNSSTATALQTGRTFSLSGDGTGTSGAFDGTAAATIPLTLATVNASPQTDTFRKITVNGKGLVTATSAVVSGDITTALGFTPVNKNGDTMTGLLILSADPSSALGAATKQYVDNIAAGLTAKASVNTGTTATLAVSSGGTVTYANGAAGVGATLTTTGNFNTIGGAAVINGNRILVKDEATQANNGIYVRTSATVLTRATDYDNSISGEIAGGDFVFVSTGTLNGTNWVQTTPSPITVGTTAIVFTQLSGPGTYVAGTGISLTGNVIANTGVLSNIAGTGIGVSGATGNVTITNNGVTSAIGTANQIVVSAATGAVTFSLPSAVTVSGAVTAGSFAGAGTGLTGTAANLTSGTATNIVGGSVGSLVYQSGASTTAFLPAGTTSQVLIGGASFPAWTSTPSGLTSVTATTFTGALSGNATTATTLQTARNINGVSFNGSADITITAANPSALTMNNSGAGAVSGTTYTGAAAQTISYNTIGASPLAGSSSLVTTGTITSGTWNAGVIAGQYGGTGVNNSGKTITIGGNFTTVGAFTTTLTATGNTSLTMPVAGTLATLAGAETFSNKTFAGSTEMPIIFINRQTNTASGIQWYNNSTYNAWANYMSSSGVASTGPRGTITAPSGTLVTGLALRSFAENTAGMGWTFESGASTSTTPAVVAEIRSSDGAARFGGALTASNLSLGGTLTTGGALTVSGAFATTLNVTGATNITLPTTGTIYSGSAAPVLGGVIYGSSATQYGSTAVGTAGQALTSNGAAAPVWATLDLTYLPDSWVKKSVRAASTVIQPITARTATTLTIGGTALTYDGVVLANGDRVLVKNSTSGTGAGLWDNGVYVVSGIGTSVVLTRSSDSDNASELGGATVNVDQGTLNGGLVYTNDFKTTSTVGTTAMNWYQLLSINDASSTNTASKVVIRDASGNFAAGTITAALTGNATTATTLQTGRTFSVSGDGTGTSGAFDGSAAATIPLTLATVNSNVGTFGSATVVPVITVNAKGLITAVSTATITASSSTNLAGGTTGALVYQSAPSTTAFLTAGTASQVLIGGAAAPAWSSTPAGLTSVTATTFIGALTGNSSTTSAIAVTDDVATNATYYPTFAVASTGTPALRVSSSKLTYNPSTGVLTGVTFAGALSGNATSATNVAGGTTGALHYQSGVGATAFLAAGTASQVLVGGPSAPSWSSTPSGLTSVTATTFTGALSGNATTATALQTARNISASGDATWTVSFNGSADATAALTLATVNASPQSDTFRRITVNGKGLVTATSAVLAADITTALGFTPVNRNGDTMTGLLILSADPSAALGAATKQYVDNVAAGLSAKTSVNTATTATLAVSSGGTVTYANGTAGVGATLTTTGNFNSIGGFTTANGNRILVKDEAAQANNGIYVRTSATVLTRATDFDNSPSGEVEGGDFTFVSSGTLSGTNWVLTTGTAITIGTTGLVFSQLSGPGTYTAGTGISITNNVITNTGVTSATGTANQITVSASTGAVTFSLPSAVTISGAMTAGSFSGAGTSLTGTAAGLSVGGNAGTATTLQTARNINGVSFNGSADITITAANPNALTMNNSGSGAASGTTYTGAAAQTISYNTIGASPLAGSSSITTLGTVTTGTWNAGVIAGQYGGTGVANTGKTITIGGNFATTGAFTTTLNVTGNTTVTLPTTGTLATLDGAETLTAKILTAPQINAGKVGVSATVTAGTNAQGQGALTSDFNIITVNASNPGGVTLPTATAGRTVSLSNRTANALNVYPAAGASIDGQTVNTPRLLSPGEAIYFTAGTTTAWYTAGSSSSGFTFSASVPVGPHPGDRWLNDSDGILYTYFNDGSSSQWVELGKSPLFSVPTAPLYIQDTQPVDESAYLWVQTGLGDTGEDFTFWINIV